MRPRIPVLHESWLGVFVEVDTEPVLEVSRAANQANTSA